MPCKTIAVANQKGGTGKTATTLSLGVALARLGKRVLLVDTDPQGDLTKSLGWKDPDSLETTLADHLAAVIAGEPLTPAEGILSHCEGVDLMPANIELAGMEMAVFMAMSREQDAGEKVREIVLSDIESFPGHPFKVADDEDMARLAESIVDNGVLVPLTVRPLGDGMYGLVSGHRRKRAAEIAGLAVVPCVVRRMGDEEATIAMVDSNLHRETILPSEWAFAYSMRLEAMKRQGQRTDLTCAQVAYKSSGRRSRDILAEELGVSKDKVQRFIRLTFLVPQLLSLVDAGRMKMLPAVEVSYLAEAEQLRIPRRSIARFFRPSATQSEIEGRIVKALELLEQAERRRDGLGGA